MDDEYAEQRKQLAEEERQLEDLRNQQQQHKSTISHTSGLIAASEKKISDTEDEIFAKVR